MTELFWITLEISQGFLLHVWYQARLRLSADPVHQHIVLKTFSIHIVILCHCFSVYTEFKVEPEYTTVYKGHTATLHCQATGDPQPYIQWIVKDKPLSLSTSRSIFISYIWLHFEDQVKYNFLNFISVIDWELDVLRNLSCLFSSFCNILSFFLCLFLFQISRDAQWFSYHQWCHYCWCREVHLHRWQQLWHQTSSCRALRRR